MNLNTTGTPVVLEARTSTAIKSVGTVPRVHLKLSRPSYEIEVDPLTGTPHMPKNVIAWAEVLDWPSDQPAPSAFTWRVAVDWNYPPYPTHHDISKTTFRASSPLTVDFGKQIRGGKLTVFAKTILNGKPLFGKVTATIRGVNPPRSAILRAFPHSRFGLLASKVAAAESDMLQFVAGDAKNVVAATGMPQVSRTNDVGIMQLNAPTGSITSQDQIWDWRANVRRGMEELKEKRQMAQHVTAHPESVEPIPHENIVTFRALNFYRQFIGLKPLPLPTPPILSDRPGTGVMPEDPDVDHLALSQVERETLRRYNGGREYSYRIMPDAGRPELRYAEWHVDPSRGGMPPRSGDLDYVRHVLKAKSGMTLPVNKSQRNSVPDSRPKVLHRRLPKPVAGPILKPTTKIRSSDLPAAHFKSTTMKPGGIEANSHDSRSLTTRNRNHQSAHTGSG